MHRRAVAVASLVLLTGTASPALAAGCAGLVNGQYVSLKSAEIDPDVFVWDAKARVIEYSSGVWRTTSDVMNHTLLSEPGTRAVIVACNKESVKSKYADSVLDAIGIRLLTGPNRGRYGWVTSEDVHPAPRNADTVLLKKS